MLLHILAGIGYGRKTSRHKICLALQDLAVLLNENPLSSPGKLSLPCLSHPWFACFHFFARRKYELTTKSKRFSMIFIFIALSRPVSDKFAVHLPRNPRESVPGSLSCRPPGTAVPLIMGCRGFSAGQMSSFQHGACSRLHTCSREVCASI